MIPPSPPLLLITDRGMARRALADVVAAAFEGGCRWVMVREKDLSTAALTDLAAGIVAVARGCGATVLINGDAHAARQSGAQGVHLPRGRSVADARAVLGSGGAVGVSAHGMEEAAAAARTGADYVTLSPVFATPSKLGYGPCVGTDGLKDVAEAVAVPVLALGGIGAANAGACLAAGAAGVAVMGPVMRARDPRSVVAALVRALAADDAGRPPTRTGSAMSASSRGD